MSEKETYTNPDAEMEEVEGKIHFFRGRFSKDYGEGHFILACHAAFPVALTVDLLYQIWANFKVYTKNGEKQVIPILAVSDLILSSLLRQTGKDVYEMDPLLRNYLLDELRGDMRFGEKRVKELAVFLYQYIQVNGTTDEWRNFNEAQRWTALMTLDPAKAARNVLQTLMDNAGGADGADIGISSFIESFIRDNEDLLDNMARQLPMAGKEEPAGAGKKEEVRSVIVSQGEVAGAVKLDIRMPETMDKKIGEMIERRKEREVRATDEKAVRPGAERTVYCLFVVIEDYTQSLTSEYGPAMQEIEAFVDGFSRQDMHLLSNSLVNTMATRDNIVNSLRKFIEAAAPNDTLFFYFFGGTDNGGPSSRLILWGDTVKAPALFTAQEFSEIVKAADDKQLYVVVVLDAAIDDHGKWLNRENPRHFLLIASPFGEVLALSSDRILMNASLSLMKQGGSFTYGNLFKQVVKQSMHQYKDKIHPQFNVHSSTWDNYFLSDEINAYIPEWQEVLTKAGYYSGGPSADEPVLDAARKRFVQELLPSPGVDATAYLQILLSLKGKEALNVAIFSGPYKRYPLEEIRTLFTHPLVKQFVHVDIGVPMNEAMLKDIDSKEIWVIDMSDRLVKEIKLPYMQRLLDLAYAMDKLVVIIKGGVSYQGMLFSNYIAWPSGEVSIGNPEGLARAREGIAKSFDQLRVFLSPAAPVKNKVYNTGGSARIKVLANSDRVFIAWYYRELIADYSGFAIYRKRNNGESEVLPNFFGFIVENEQPLSGPSTVMPIQGFKWIDYEVNPGDEVAYMVVPLILVNDKLKEAVNEATGWSDGVHIATNVKVEAYFNRGLFNLISARTSRLPPQAKRSTLDSELLDNRSEMAQYLGGELVRQLFLLLDNAIRSRDVELYACLPNVTDEKVIGRFEKIGPRLHLILAEAFRTGLNMDRDKVIQNRLLKKKVEFLLRKTGSRIAHNKFILVCKKGKPVSVWTGSASLTPSGLYKQVNNAVVINDKNIAAQYLHQWRTIKDIGNGFPAHYAENNTRGNTPSGGITTWFCPVRQGVDLERVTVLLKRAKQSVLFLVFNPGVSPVFETIEDMQKKTSGIFVMGVREGHPEGRDQLTFLCGQDKQTGAFRTDLMGNLQYFFNSWKKEANPLMTGVRSRVLVIDPFGAHPVVITGSHGLSRAASKMNDENLNIIEGNAALAAEYAVNIMSVYSELWGIYMAKARSSSQVFGKHWTWVTDYFTPSRLQELSFIFGTTLRTPGILQDAKTTALALGTDEGEEDSTERRQIRIYLSGDRGTQPDEQAVESFIKTEIARKNASLRIATRINIRMEKSLDLERISRRIRESDIYILLLHARPGKFTEEEFHVAYNEYKETGKPVVCVFIKNRPVQAGDSGRSHVSQSDFMKQLNQLGQFVVPYDDPEVIKTHLRRLFDDMTKDDPGA